MGKKVRILAMVLCGMIQAVVLVMYSFTESEISAIPFHTDLDGVCICDSGDSRKKECSIV